MKNSVKVAVHPETKLVVTPSKNKPEYGTMRVEETGMRFTNGFVNSTKRSAFIRGKIKDLASFYAGQELPGQIVARETRQPQYEGHSPKINPTTSELVLVNGANVYLSFEYTEDLSAKDQLIQNSPVVIEKEKV